MSDEGGFDDRLAENPLLARLLREAGPADSMTFWGYIGPSRDEGLITLHYSLENVRDCIEIPRSDVLHVEDVPESVMLFGAKVIWVRRDAVIGRRLSDTAQVTGTLKPPPAAGSAPASAESELSEGRLRMKVNSQSLRTQLPSADCHSPCATCRSCSSVCVSSCRAPATVEA